MIKQGFDINVTQTNFLIDKNITLVLPGLHCVFFVFISAPMPPTSGVWLSNACTVPWWNKMLVGSTADLPWATSLGHGLARSIKRASLNFYRCTSTMHWPTPRWRHTHQVQWQWTPQLRCRCCAWSWEGSSPTGSGCSWRRRASRRWRMPTTATSEAGWGCGSSSPRRSTATVASISATTPVVWRGLPRDSIVQTKPQPNATISRGIKDEKPLSELSNSNSGYFFPRHFFFAQHFCSNTSMLKFNNYLDVFIIASAISKRS